MKKILIFSDTHGHTDPCIRLIEQEHPNAVIHAGDCVRDAEDLTYAYPNIPIYFVQGNNDLFTGAPPRMTVIIDGVKIFITHGHEYRVKYEADYRTLKNAASTVSSDLVIFGHTHIPYVDYSQGAVVLNPGSVRFSGTYAVAEIENGNVKTSIFDI